MVVSGRIFAEEKSLLEELKVGRKQDPPAHTWGGGSAVHGMGWMGMGPEGKGAGWLFYPAVPGVPVLSAFPKQGVEQARRSLHATHSLGSSWHTVTPLEWSWGISKAGRVRMGMGMGSAPLPD